MDYIDGKLVNYAKEAGLVDYISGKLVNYAKEAGLVDYIGHRESSGSPH